MRIERTFPSGHRSLSSPRRGYWSRPRAGMCRRLPPLPPRGKVARACLDYDGPTARDCLSTGAPAQGRALVPLWHCNGRIPTGIPASQSVSAVTPTLWTPLSAFCRRLVNRRQNSWSDGGRTLLEKLHHKAGTAAVAPAKDKGLAFQVSKNTAHRRSAPPQPQSGCPLIDQDQRTASPR